MDRIVDRETLDMMRFADASYEISDRLEEVCTDLYGKTEDAGEYMQQENGKEAIGIVKSLIDSTLEAVHTMRILADQVMLSAELLEEADGLLDGSTSTGRRHSFGRGNGSGEISMKDRPRYQAIKDAWAKEVELVKEGRGTRDWTASQQAELLQYGRVSGFEGNHMKSAKDFPQYAGDYNNIQFLTYEEHFYGAHEGNWRNDPNGRMDYSTGKMVPLAEDEVPSRKIISLTDRYDPSQEAIVSQLGRDFGYARHEDIQNTRGRVFGK